ncbi:MAG: polysulfide reductase NrfD [Candidatus Latescibacteria bacterium]|nr:polysulfide reductase NrfD [Candidatus Latescibacterota bacterium]
MSEATDKMYQPPAPVLAAGQSHTSITGKISDIVLTSRTPVGWGVAFLISFLVFQVFLVALSYLLYEGVGVWGLNNPVSWGFAIVHFVWWIGIGHAGTLISAILLLLRQQWRNAINRFAEAMTIFAVICAAVFPVFHTGRPWLAIYWLLPYPNSMGVWPQFRSPLMWDVFAVSTYFSVSLVFWYLGLIPDLATFRDRAKNRVVKTFYGVLALGWRNSAAHWHRYEMASLLLAGLSTPLVLSVHRIVSFDFSTSLIPGWHTTLFPPSCVAGAVFAGFAMVLTLGIPIRKIYGLEQIITERHLNNMAKVMLATGLIVAYGYFMEAFMAWYSASSWEQFMMKNRQSGPYGGYYWMLILCNCIVPQLLWSKRCRLSTTWLMIVSMFINVGMWLERFVIVVTSLHRDFMPSSWAMYSPTKWDWSLYIGTFGIFFTLFFLFIRVLPMIAIAEIRALVPESEKGK